MPYYSELVREHEIEESIVVSITIIAGERELAFNLSIKSLELGDDIE